MSKELGRIPLPTPDNPEVREELIRMLRDNEICFSIRVPVKHAYPFCPDCFTHHSPDADCTL